MIIDTAAFLVQPSDVIVVRTHTGDPDRFSINVGDVELVVFERATLRRLRQAVTEALDEARAASSL